MRRVIVQCCVCGKVRHGKQWLRHDGYIELKRVSHGYCPGCAAEALAEIRAWFAGHTPTESLLPPN